MSNVTLRWRFGSAYHVTRVSVSLREEIYARWISRRPSSSVYAISRSSEVRRINSSLMNIITIWRTYPTICFPTRQPTKDRITPRFRYFTSYVRRFQYFIQYSLITQVRAMRIKRVTILEFPFLRIVCPFL